MSLSKNVVELMVRRGERRRLMLANKATLRTSNFCGIRLGISRLLRPVSDCICIGNPLRKRRLKSNV